MNSIIIIACRIIHVTCLPSIMRQLNNVNAQNIIIKFIPKKYMRAVDQKLIIAIYFEWPNANYCIATTKGTGTKTCLFLKSTELYTKITSMLIKL